MAVVNAAATGLWSNPNTWAGGSVPSAADDVFIENGHRVTFDLPEDGNTSSDVKTITVRKGGQLKFSRAASTRLDLGGSLMVMANGTLDVGTPQDPIPHDVSATIGFNVPNDRLFKGNTEPGPDPDMPDFHPGDIGIWTMMSGAKSTFVGAAKNFTWTKLASPAAAGSDKVTLDTVPTGWRVGDKIIVTPTQEDPDQVETRTIAAINGATITLEQPLDHFHQSALFAFDPDTESTRKISSEADLTGNEMLLPIQAEVGLLTHNVTVQSNLVTENSPNHRAHTVYMMGATGTITNAEFRDLGPRGKLGRYPVHFHKLGGTGFDVDGASIWSSIEDPGNKFIVTHGTEGVRVEDTVAFNAQGSGFYLEDATEVGNTFHRNLGVRVHGPEEIPGNPGTEFNYEGEAASIFWLRDGNTFTDNVAVGSVGGAVGLWSTPSLGDTTGHATIYSGNESRSNFTGARHSGDGSPTTLTFSDTLIGLNQNACITDAGVTLAINDSLLYGNAIGATGDGGADPTNTHFVDYARVPRIEILADDNPLWANSESYDLNFVLHDGPLRTDVSQNFSVSDGPNVLTATSQTLTGGSASRDWTVYVDTVAPTITINSNRNPSITNSGTYLLKYTVHDDGKDLFRHESFQLTPGANTVYVTARDLAGNIASASYNVTFDSSEADPGERDGNVTFTDGTVADSDIITGQFYVNPTANNWPGSIRPLLRIVDGTVTLRIDSSQLGDTSTAQLRGLQYLINRDVVSPVVAAGESGDFEFLWDSTSLPDGTYALSVRFVEGTEIHGFQSGVAWLAVDNVAGAVSGEQQIPITAYKSRKPDGGVLPGVDTVGFSGAQLKKSGDAYPYAYSPPANQASNPADYRDASIWFLEEAVHATSPNDGQNAVLYRSPDGHVFSDVSYTLVTPESEGAVTREERVDYLDGHRNSASTSGFSTFVPNPEGPGWVGVDVTGRIFRVDLDGTVTTIAGRKVRDDVVPFSTEIGPSTSEFESHQIEYIGEFEGGLHFNTPNDLYFDPFDSKILYVADTNNHRIAKVDLHGDVPRITTFAGTAGVAGYSDGAGDVARFSAPYSVVADWRTGELYVADRDNHAIRRISQTGEVSTVVGRGANTLPLPETTEDSFARRDSLTRNAALDAANINYPQVLRLDSEGNIIFGEHTTHSIRRVDLQTGSVEYIFNIPIKFSSTWIWLDVDWRGNIGPKDDIVVTATQTTAASGSFNNLVWRVGPDGTKYGPVAPQDKATGHYPWAIAIDDAEARIVSTGVGGNGLRSVVAQPGREAPPVWYDAWVGGHDVLDRGSVFDVPAVADGQPSLRALYGNRASGFSRIPGVLVFDDLDRLSDAELADYIQSGMGGSVPRPDITGYDLDQLIYYIRSEAMHGAFVEPDRPTLPDDTTAPEIRKIHAEQVGDDRVRLTWYTNEPAIGVVEHGVLPGIYHESSPLTDGFDDFQHTLIVDGLSSTQVNYLQLHVKDEAGNIQISDEFTVILDSSGAGNSPPEAIPQAASVLKNTNRPIQLRGSDVNGDSLTYRLTALPDHGTITDFDPVTGALTYVPNSEYLGNDLFQFTVNDGEFESNSASVRISVVVDAPPEITSFTNDIIDRDENKAGLQVYPGDAVTFSATARDPEGKPLNYWWKYAVNGGQSETLDSGVGTIPDSDFIYPDGSVGSEYTHTIEVSDGLGSDSVSATVQVIARPAPGIVGHWSLNDGSGTTPWDSSGYRNHATVPNTSSWSEGPLGGATDLADGDVLDAGNPPQFRFTHLDPFSVAFWFRRDAQASVNGVLIDKSHNGRKVQATYNTYGFVTIELFSGWTTGIKVSAAVSEDFDGWQHYTLTYDGSTKASGVQFFVNGAAKTLTVHQDNLAGTIDNESNLTVGSFGSLDDVRVYNLALPQNEIASVMSGTRTAILTDAGVLQIDGTAGRDYARIDERAEEVLVTFSKTEVYSFDTTDVTGIIVRAGDDRDRIFRRGGKTIPTTIFGESGDDTIKGGGSDDLIVGGDGNDKLNGGGGNDRVEGGRGNDILRGASGRDTIIGLHGNDWISAGNGPDFLTGGGGSDTLLADKGDDTVYGGGGSDFLQGGGNDDKLDGGSQDDTLFGSSGSDLLIGGRGNDLITAANGNDTLKGEDGRDTLLGESGNDLVDGGRGDDLLLGGDGSDTILGGENDDLLVGGTGSDDIAGHDGTDILIGASTTYQSDLISLTQIFDTWLLPGTYVERTTALRTGAGGVPVLAASTVVDDSSVDELEGGLGADWFFADRGVQDLILDLAAFEIDELKLFP